MSPHVALGVGFPPTIGLDAKLRVWIDSSLIEGKQRLEQMVSKKSVAVLGSGGITPFHLDALRAVGFDISTIFSRPGSARLQNLAHQFQIPRSRDFEEFSEIAANSDGVLLAIETSAMEEHIVSLSKLDTPLLIEKPGALSSRALRSIDKLSPNLIARVAYNRRFYESVRMAKALKPKVLSATALWPEPSKSDEAFIKNGVHFVDLLRFVFGDFKIEGHKSLGANQGFASLLTSLEGGIPVSFQAVFGATTNAEIRLFLEDDSVFEIRPLESSRLFKDFKVLQPTETRKVRVYKPLQQEVSSEDSSNFKPGFLAQAEEFLAICSSPQDQQSGQVLPTLKDAVGTLELAEKLVSSISPSLSNLKSGQ